MNDRISDWCRFVDASADPSYKPKALLAVLKTDGPQALGDVLKRLKLERSEDLVRAML